METVKGKQQLRQLEEPGGSSMLPVMKPCLPSLDAYSTRLQQIDTTRRYSNYGPQLIELQDRFAARLNVLPSQVLIVANTTLAITGLVQLLEPLHWRVPSWTFAATALAVRQAGNDLTFVDVDVLTHRVPSDFHRGPTVATLPFGAGIPQEWIASSTFPEIIDGAASLGNVPDLSMLPQHSSIVFSLHATKYLGAGEGGVVVAGNPEVARLLREWSNFGFGSSRESLFPGTNAKMSEFQAAVAHAALDRENHERLDWQKLRQWSADVDDALGVGIPKVSSDSISPYWIIDLKSPEKRDAAEEKLRSLSIESRRWWSNGCHVMPAFVGLPLESNLRATEQLAGSTLGLPFFRGMNEDDFGRIHAALSTL